MNRQQRREAERQKKKEGKAAAKRAAIQLEKDIQRDGLFDAKAALSDPYYMQQVLKSRESQRRGMEQNGITQADLKAEYERGYAAARKDLAEFIEKMFYSALALSLKRLYKFGQTRIHRTLEAVRQTMTEEICTADIMEKCKQETGIEICVTDYDI